MNPNNHNTHSIETEYTSNGQMPLEFDKMPFSEQQSNGVSNSLEIQNRDAILDAKNGRFPEAIQTLLDCVNKNENFFAACYNLGIVYGLKQDYIMAERYFIEANRLSPNCASVMQGLALCSFFRGHYSNCLEICEQYNKLYSDRTLFSLAELCRVYATKENEERDSNTESPLSSLGSEESAYHTPESASNNVPLTHNKLTKKTSVSTRSLKWKLGVLILSFFVLAICVVLGIQHKKRNNDEQKNPELAQQAKELEEKHQLLVQQYKRDIEDVCAEIWKQVGKANDQCDRIIVYCKLNNKEISVFPNGSAMQSEGQALEIAKRIITEKMKKLANPPEEWKEAYDILLSFYSEYCEFTRMASNPSGSLQAYSDKTEALYMELLGKARQLNLYVSIIIWEDL